MGLVRLKLKLKYQKYILVNKVLNAIIYVSQGIKQYLNLFPLYSEFSLSGEMFYFEVTNFGHISISI